MKKVLYISYNEKELIAYYHMTKKINPYKVYEIKNGEKVLLEEYADFQSVLFLLSNIYIADRSKNL